MPSFYDYGLFLLFMWAFILSSKNFFHLYITPLVTKFSEFSVISSSKVYDINEYFILCVLAYSSAVECL